MATDPAAPPVRDDEYPGTAVAGAAIATFFFPIISLIAALLLMSNEQGRKRAQLRMWAWASGGWLAVQSLIFIIAVAAIASSGPDFDSDGPCQGGPQIGYSAVVQPDGTYVIPCVFGGSVTMRE
jgi:hypothetical protein